MVKQVGIFCACVLLIFLGGFRAPAPKIPLVRPNVLFLAVDDLNLYSSTLGHTPESFLGKVYPDSTVRQAVLDRLTPNLKRFAQKAVTFERTYCAFPLCGPSRTALLTGVPPHVSGYYSHEKHFRHYPTLEKVITLPQYLTQEGYFTCGVGKIFHKGRAYLDRGTFSDWPDRLYSWSEWIERPIGTGKAPGIDFQAQETLSPFWDPQDGNRKRYTRFGTTTLPRQYSNDYQNALHIAQLVQAGSTRIIDMHGSQKVITLPEDQPFFLACGLFAPHLPWVVPAEYWDMFPADEMAINEELLQWVMDDLADLSPYGQRRANHSTFGELLAYADSTAGANGPIAAWQTIMRAYLASIAFTDRNLGLLLDAVEQSPAYEQTIVVLWSDHGYHIGDKHREGKTTLWEAANRCHLMMFDPATYTGSTSWRRHPYPVSLQDIYPTIVSLTGLPRPKHVYGQDLSPLLTDPTLSQSRTVLSTNKAGSHSLRSTTYRYIRFPNGDEELYDMIEDPLEEHNLVSTLQAEPILDSLRHQLQTILSMGPADN